MPTRTNVPVMVQIDNVERPATPEEKAHIDAIREGDAEPSQAE